MSSQKIRTTIKNRKTQQKTKYLFGGKNCFGWGKYGDGGENMGTAVENILMKFSKRYSREFEIDNSNG